MAVAKKKRIRDPETTRAAILDAARTLLAKDGPEGTSLSAVAALAGVNRGTAYQHFETREKLIDATVLSVSDELFNSVFGGEEEARERRVEQRHVLNLTETLASFAVENPELCRIWFLQRLASPEPANDRFWREYVQSLRHFAGSDMAKPGIDCEVTSLIMLAGNFLWPVWAKTHEKTPDERRALAHRFAKECLRLSLYGNMIPEKYPDIAHSIENDA